MPLSEHEQRILEEIERRLVADDPKFARDVAAASSRGGAQRRVRRAAAGFAAGFALLIVGLFVPRLLVALGIGAFAVMVTSAAVIARNLRELGSSRPASRVARSGWFSRMEDRWRKRFDSGEGT